MAYGNQNTNYFPVNSPESYVNRGDREFSCSELCSFSIDEGNFYNNNRRELRSLIPNYQSKYGSDLTVGFDPSLPASHSNLDRPLDPFLHWIVLNKEDISGGTSSSSKAQRQLYAEFVLVTATMKNLLATVFNTGSYEQPWKMYAAKYNGTIYISREEEEIKAVGGPPREPRLGCRDQDEERKKILYMGKKLEEVISEPSELQDEPADLNVDGRQGFYSVRRGRFSGRHLVLITSEVDFVENDEYMECKLCLEYTGRDEWKFPMNKLRDWWYHMYAGDMKQVVYGIRDGSRLKQVSRVTQSEIPSQVNYPRMSCPPKIESALRSWNPQASIGFVDDFLQWLKGVVVEDSYGMEEGRAVQYVLEWKKGSSSIACSREEARMPNFVLLPDWYIREMSAFFAA